MNARCTQTNKMDVHESITMTMNGNHAIATLARVTLPKIDEVDDEDCDFHSETYNTRASHRRSGNISSSSKSDSMRRLSLSKTISTSP